MAPIKKGWSRSQLFNQGWVDDLAPVANSGMTAKVLVFFQETVSVGYNPDTGEMEYETEPITLYEGVGRVQPMRMARNVPNNAADTIVQAVRFQIPVGDYGIRPKHRIRVLEADLNPDLVNFEYVIQGVMNSSNPFEITLEAQVDTEVVAEQP